MGARSFVISLTLSAGLATAANSSAPPPSPAEQAAVIEATRNAALTFSDALPDFICTQVTRRWVNQGHTPSNLTIAGPRMRQSESTVRLGDSEQWKLRDTLTIQLTYFGQKEQYKLLLVNGLQTKQSYESVGGTTDYGDFGSVLGILFQASSEAKFTWDHWGVLNGQPVMVFSFYVVPAHSQWHIAYGSQDLIAAFKGLVFIEPAQHQVLKLKVNADGIPKKFPIQKSGVELDYRRQAVGDRQFLLPLKATDWTDTKNVSTKNEAEFRLYRKFSTDSKIDFDTPAPLPENQIKDTIPNN
jgi:hypothetical protein